jgi:predicted transcriptional regulator
VPKTDAPRPKARRDAKEVRDEKTLGRLRTSLGITQQELGRRAKMTQSEISRVELRSDCLVSTLQRYAEALDGELQLCVQIDGRSYPVRLG